MEKEYLYPVTKEELNNLFNSYHNGSQEARESIILLYIPLTYKYVEEYFSFYNCDIDDLNSVATIGSRLDKFWQG